MSPDRLAAALAALRAAGTGAGIDGNDVDDEAAQFVAGVSQGEPGARRTLGGGLPPPGVIV